MTNNKNTKQGKTSRNIIITVLALIVVVLIVLLLRSCGADGNNDTTPHRLFFDNAAVEGGWDEADLDVIVDNLNEKVEAGMINISMNTAPVFSDGTSAGNLMIVNESCNNYPQIVVITRNDTGEEIYRSGGIPVGSKIEAAPLATDLPAGTYECTAMFHNVDPTTGDSLGCAGAIISITVLE